MKGLNEAKRRNTIMELGIENGKLNLEARPKENTSLNLPNAIQGERKNVDKDLDKDLSKEYEELNVAGMLNKTTSISKNLNRREKEWGLKSCYGTKLEKVHIS